VSLTIRVHTDLDLTSNLLDPADAGACLVAYCDQLFAALRAAYPDARVYCTFARRTGGGGSYSVEDAEGCPDHHERDRVRQIANDVYETWEWFRPAN
jgi:hypothetical protein